MPITSHADNETRLIILLRGKSPEVFLVREAARWTLPRVEIPRWKRIAEHVTAKVRETYGVEGVSLSSLAPVLEKSCRQSISYEIMESCPPWDESPPGGQWIAFNSISQGEFCRASEFQAVRQAIADTTNSSEDAKNGPFGRVGWFQDLKHWVQGQIGYHGLNLNGQFRHLNASPTFCLIRFETNGPAVWFKAVGNPNEREHSVTLVLAHHFSRFVPRIIATHPGCNGWLALEVEGTPLCECFSMTSWETAATSLAELQITSLGQNLHFLDAGARDLRSRVLSDLVEPFFECMNVWMQRQTKSSPPPLSSESLHSLAARVRGAITLLDGTGIPSTVGHLDINPGNIIDTPTGSVFLDWAEAFVGHPFFTFQYLVEHFRRTFGVGHSCESQLAASYTRPWRAFASESDIRLALDVAPFLAVFACGVGNESWKKRQKLELPSVVAGYLRGLTRRMDRESRTFEEWSMPCRRE
jgi:hypothetical protein